MGYKIERINKLIILVVLTFSILPLLSSIVSAQQTGCCEKTTTAYSNPAQYCISGIEKNQCEGTFHSFKQCSDVDSCNLGVAICKEGCTTNKTKMEAIDSSCSWNQEKNPENIGQCKEGCCSIPSGLVCTVKQNVACKEEAGKSNYSFVEGIKKDSICSNYCGQQEYGTCVSSDGCSYLTKKECIDKLKDETLQQDANFFPATNVCDVTQCGALCEDELGCGKNKYGNDEKICWYDSEGNIGECIYDCGGIDYTCTDCKADECDDSKRNVKAEKGEPYCKYTGCNVNLKYGGQEWDDNNKEIKNLENNQQKTILNTRSICYNFYTKFNDPDMLISTGLQNSKIVCHDGDSEQQTFGEDRKRLCEQRGVDQGLVCVCDNNEVNNDYENCRKCGAGGSSIFGDVFQTATLQWLTKWIGDDQCTEDKCESLGDCVYHEDYNTRFSASIGSCDPKFPVGSSESCSECGKGGDALYNLPTKKECFSLGNCDYSSRASNPVSHIKDYVATFTAVLYGERLSWTPVEGALGVASSALCLIPGGSIFAGKMCGGCIECLVYGPSQFIRYGVGLPVDIIWNYGIQKTIKPGSGKIIEFVKGSVEKIFKK